MLITGCRGFIATSYATGRELSLERGYSFGPFIETAETDKNPDTVLHLGAISGIDLCEKHIRDCVSHNVANTAEIAEFAASQNEINKIIFASSAAAKYLLNLYGVSKFMCEEILRAHQQRGHFSATSLRFSNVYGPGSVHKTSEVATMCHQALAASTVLVHGTGKETRDFIHISDVCTAIDAAILSNSSGPQNICTGIQTSVLDVAHMVADLTGAKVEHIESTEPQLMRAEMAPTRDMNWCAKIALQEGIGETVEYFRGLYERS